MCREAVASEQASFADGLNRSILFMLSMVVLIPTGFGFMVWKSYRSQSAKALDGETFTPAGKLRWEGGQGQDHGHGAGDTRGESPR